MNEKQHSNSNSSFDKDDLNARITKIIQSLKSYRLKYESQRDSRAIFTYTYELMTIQIGKSLFTSGFLDPAWIVKLDEEFASRYFIAMDAYDEGGEVPAGWSYILNVLHQRRTSVLEEMIIGMVAHIVWDLPLALAETGQASNNSETRLHDFHLMNDVLGHSINLLQDSVGKRYNPMLNLLDKLFGTHDEIITNFGIRIARGIAWYNACRLQNQYLKSDTMRSIAESPEHLAKEILTPKLWTLAFITRLFRIFLSLFRRWNLK